MGLFDAVPASVPRLASVSTVDRGTVIAQQSSSALFQLQPNPTLLLNDNASAGRLPDCRKWAAKVVSVKDHPEMAATLPAEAAALRQLAVLDGPAAAAVPALVAVGDDEAEAVVVMTYAKACPLQRLFFLFPRGLEPSAVRNVAAQLVCILEAVHAAGLVHRDVKLPNVLWAESGAVSLVDFGLACPCGDPSATAVGTLHARAPEVDTGGYATAAGDVYMLGVLLFELAFGAPPFRGQFLSHAAAVAQGHPGREGLVECPSRGDPALCDAVRAMLRDDPAARLGGPEGSWAAVRQHPFFAAAPGGAAFALPGLLVAAADAVAPYADEIDMQLLGM